MRTAQAERVHCDYPAEMGQGTQEIALICTGSAEHQMPVRFGWVADGEGFRECDRCPVLHDPRHETADQ
jgi:hypothetical protein